MADAINRIVPSSVALDRASGQGRERQRRKETEARGGTQPLDEQAMADINGDGGPAPKEINKDKGNHLDVSA
jgi:hypothetical protein